MRLLSLAVVTALLSLGQTSAGAVVSDDPGTPVRPRLERDLVPPKTGAPRMPQVEPTRPGPVPMPHVRPAKPGPVPMPEAGPDPRTLVVPPPR